MRRFAALFKRDDKSPSTSVSSDPIETRSTRTTKTPSVKKPSRFFRSLSVKTVKSAVIREPPPSLPQPPLQASSFSTSSTESPVPATPDDDSEFGSGPAHRNSNQWSERGLTLPLPTASGSLGWDLLPKPPSRLPLQSAAKPSDSEDSDDTSSVTSSPPSASSPLPVSPRNSLHSLTTYALAPAFSAPPLLSIPNVPLFPRSANSVSSLPHQETVATMLFRSQILRRLDSRDMSASEERSVTTFTSRRHLSAKSQFFLSKLDDEPVRNLKRVSNISQGLKRWVSRPCFEDRMSVYTPGPSGRPDDIVVNGVSGGAFGVAALEISESIDVLAGYNIEEKVEAPWLPALLSFSTTDLQLPVPVAPANPTIIPHAGIQPQKADLSPRPNETTASPDQPKALKPKQPPLQSSLSRASPPSTSPANVTQPKRVRSSVRFDVDEKQDKDEHVPLGQIMRIKRGREERAKFLELERERRALEEERQKHEAEKKKWEQERRAWEAERKVAEEEKKKRLYQQEVIAARKRRESQMFKAGLPPSDTPEIEPQSNRRQGSYSRPAYDALRQQTLDGSSPPVSHPPSRDNSSSSLRGTSKPQSLRSVPPPSGNSSNAGSSNEDVARLAGRPLSMLSGTPPQSPVMMIQPYGYPWGMSMMPQVPVSMTMQMVPQMPYYAMDNMPLLPPTAPFMMQQTGNRRNSTSLSPSRSSSSLEKAASQSVDRLPLNQGTSQIRRSVGHQRSSSGGSSNQLGNGQRSNTGSVSSRRSSGIVNDPNQWRNSTRSRPPLPQSQSHRPGSWVVPSPAPRMRQNTVT